MLVNKHPSQKQETRNGEYTYPVRTGLAHQKQDGIFQILAVLPPDCVQALLEACTIRDGQRTATQSIQEPAKHDQVFLLEKTDILRGIIHENIDQTTRPNANARV